MRKTIIIVVTTCLALFLLGNVVVAQEHQKVEVLDDSKAHRTIFKEENEIVVDVDTPNSQEVEPNLTADYQADFKDLMGQLKNQSEKYNELKQKVESNETPTSMKKDLKTKLKQEEKYLKSTAEHLLSLRYTEDKKHLKQHVIDIAAGKDLSIKDESSPYEITLGVGTRINTGNYAEEESTLLLGKTDYNHSYRDNVSGVETNEFYLPAEARVHSGAYILMQKGNTEEDALYPDISWRMLTFNGSCRTNIEEDDSVAAFNIRNIFFDVSSNTTYYYEYLNDYCLSSGDYKEFDEGPHKVTMPDMLMSQNHLYYIYMDSFANSMLGNSYGLGDDRGTRWEAIDITYN